MSRSYGWGGNDRRDDYSSRSYSNSGSSRNRSYGNNDRDEYTAPAPYSAPATRAPDVKPAAPVHTPAAPYSAAAARANQVNLDPKRDFKSRAENVIIVATDVTGSLDTWPSEIYKYLPLLYQEAQQYLGSSVEIMFIGFGDVEFDYQGDRVEAADFGQGPVLDQHLRAMSVRAFGGGNQVESSDMVALLLLKRVDTSTAKNVYTFIITDEKCPTEVDVQKAETHLGVRLPWGQNKTKDIFQELRKKQDVFLLFAETKSYPEYEDFKEFWRQMLDPAHVCPLERANLAVEAILAVIAKVTNQLATFDKNYDDRRGNTAYGEVNRSIVRRSIAMVQGPGPAPVNLAAKSKRLDYSDLDDGVTPSKVGVF